VGGGALIASASGLGALAPTAFADAVPAGDLASLRLLIAGELLAVDFYGQATERPNLLVQQYAARANRIAADEAGHYDLLAALMTAAGQTPATADDIDFSYPKAVFKGASSVLRFAQQLEFMLVGSYLHAVANVQTQTYRQTLAQILATEAKHQSAIAGLQGRPLLGKSLPAPIAMDTMSDFLDKYES
jgi:rubrerythrin